MRALPIVLAAVGAISLLTAAVPAKADWDDYGRSGWRGHRAWGPGYYYPAQPRYYRYGYVRPIAPYRYARPVVVVRPPIVVVRPRY